MQRSYEFYKKLWVVLRILQDRISVGIIQVGQGSNQMDPVYDVFVHCKKFGLDNFKRFPANLNCSMILWNYEASLAGGKKYSTLGLLGACGSLHWIITEEKIICLILYTAHTFLLWAQQHTVQHGLILWLFKLDTPGWPKLQFTNACAWQARPSALSQAEKKKCCVDN